MIERLRGWLGRHNMELLGPNFPRPRLAYRRGDKVGVKTLLWFGFSWFLAGTFLMDAQVGIAINWLHKPLEFFTISPKFTVFAIVATVFCGAFPLLVRPFWEKREGGSMVITEEEALRVLILMSHYLHHENLVVEGNPAAEGLGEVKLARRVGEEFPDLKSHVEMVLRGDY